MLNLQKQCIKKKQKNITYM